MTEREQPPHIVLVASPVPPVATEAGTLIERRLVSARELMPRGLRYRQDVLRIGYDPRLVLEDRLAVAAGIDSPAVGQYRSLAETLLQANADEIIPYVERATKLHGEGRVRDAVAELRSFVDAHPADPEGHLAFGRLLFISGQNKEARDAFLQAVKLDDTSSYAHRGVGEALLALRDAGGAVEALRRAEALGDKSPELYTALADALQATSDLTGADAARRSAAIALINRIIGASSPRGRKSSKICVPGSSASWHKGPPIQVLRPNSSGSASWVRSHCSETRSALSPVPCCVDCQRSNCGGSCGSSTKMRRDCAVILVLTQRNWSLESPRWCRARATRSSALLRGDSGDALVLFYAAISAPDAPDSTYSAAQWRLIRIVRCSVSNSRVDSPTIRGRLHGATQRVAASLGARSRTDATEPHSSIRLGVDACGTGKSG